MGATPIFVDVDKNTLCIDPNLLKKAISKRTKAVIVVHFAGLACEMDKIINIAKQNNLKVIEDAAHALPTTYKRNLIGSLDTDATVFSFYANKTITTGEGGMIVTKRIELAQRMKIMRLHGINKDAFDRYNSSKPKWIYDIVAPGFKYNLSDIAASIGIVQLKRMNALHNAREKIAHFYNDSLKDLPIQLPSMPLKGDIHSWHLYVIRLSKKIKISRDLFINNMHENGIGCSVHYIPIHNHTYWRENFIKSKEDFPQSQKAYERMISIPIYSKMNSHQIEKVASTVKKLLKGKF